MKKKNRLLKSDRTWLIAALLLLLLQFWWLPGAPRTPDDTYSNTIAGQRGFFQTLKALSEADSFPPLIRETDSLIPDRKCTLVILSPDRYPNVNEQRELTEFVQNGGNLLFAPNWESPNCKISGLMIETTEKYFQNQDTIVQSATMPGTGPAPLQAEKEEDDVPSDSVLEGEDEPSELSDVEDMIPPESMPSELVAQFDSIEATVADLDTQSPLVEGAVKWRTRAEINSSRMRPTVLVQTGEGTPQAVSWNYGLGHVLLSASADVFSNRSMLFTQQAELAVRLVERLHSTHDAPGSTPIVFSEYLNASDSYQGTGVLMNPALRSGTLQLVLLAVLAGWYGFHRFGPARPDTAGERRTLTESAAAVGNLFFRTHSGGEAVSCYLDYVRSQIQETFGSSVRLEDVQAIARRSGLNAAEVRERIDQAMVLSGARSTSPQQAADAIRGLADVMKRLSGARGE